MAQCPLVLDVYYLLSTSHTALHSRCRDTKSKFHSSDGYGWTAARVAVSDVSIFKDNLLDCRGLPPARHHCAISFPLAVWYTGAATLLGQFAFLLIIVMPVKAFRGRCPQLIHNKSDVVERRYNWKSYRSVHFSISLPA